MTTGNKASQLQSNVYIKYEAKLKQDVLVRQADGEVKWYGLVTLKNGIIVVDDIIVPKQTVSSASTDEDANALHDMIEMLGEDAQRLRYGGHSHGKMSAFHSQTDVSTIEDWGKLLGFDWFISHVQNKDGDMETRLDLFQTDNNPFRVEVECTLIPLLPKAIVEWCDEMFENYIEEKKVGFHGPHGSQTQVRGWREHSESSSESNGGSGGNRQDSKKDKKKERNSSSTETKETATSTEEPDSSEASINYGEWTEEEVEVWFKIKNLSPAEMHGGGLEKPNISERDFVWKLPNSPAYNKWIDTHVTCDKCGHSPFDHKESNVKSSYDGKGPHERSPQGCFLCGDHHTFWPAEDDWNECSPREALGRKKQRHIDELSEDELAAWYGIG